jgi:hypothetical protein
MANVFKAADGAPASSMCETSKSQRGEEHRRERWSTEREEEWRLHGGEPWGDDNMWHGGKEVWTHEEGTWL